MKRILAFLLCLAAVLSAACGRAPLYRQESFVFGTRVEILVAGLGEDRARPVATAVLQELDRLHNAYHAWQPSELSALNAALAEGKTQTVSREMAALLSDAQHLARLSDGLFDPGIGRLIRLWGFQSDEFKAALPDPAALDDWRKHRAGMVDVVIDGDRVSSRSRYVAVDFGGYLKGYALDRAATILREHGAKNALVNIGGNILALGDKNGEPWTVGIQHPRQSGPLAALKLRDGEAVGTSGDYQRFFELDGRRYCHLLDPRTAVPVMHTQSLTVLIPARAAVGAFSDMASKPLFIAGEDWPVFAEKLGVDLVLRVNAEGAVETTPGMRERLEFVGEPPKTREIVLPRRE